MARYKVRILEAYNVVVPATELIATPMFGKATKIADVPEQQFTYEAGHLFHFRNKKDLTQWRKNCPVPHELVE